MDLTHEDSLRLHVLVKTVDAIRIHEDAMEVHGLSRTDGAAREARVALHANCRADQYLRRVREFLSGIVLGSPGGYPLHLTRWTRMGQARDVGLAKLLMLGEPEAVAAVASAPGLTDELARLVWWAAPTSEHARRMLERDNIAGGVMGPILGAHLVEHLPFETDGRIIVESVRLVLQPGLIDEDTRLRLWNQGQRQGAYCVGFLQAGAEDLPKPRLARTDLPRHREPLVALAAEGNGPAGVLLRVLNGPGQTFAEATRRVLERPRDGEVVAATLDVIGRYFQDVDPGRPNERDWAKIANDAARTGVARGGENRALAALFQAVPELARDITALLTLSGVSESVVSDILAHTTATGTLLHRKLAPVTEPIREQFAVLIGAS
ncbi:MAG: sulfur reduction protein DsrS [Acidiferrobacter sp.]